MTRRIAILGGGPAALAAAYDLAKQNRGDDVITLYQMGWRIGGKCASGRNALTGDIHEHGLHVFAGFYHQSIRQLSLVYSQWARISSESVPFKDALIPVDDFQLVERGKRAIPIHLLRSNRLPDEDESSLEPVDLVAALVEVAFGQFLRRIVELPAFLRRPFESIDRRQTFFLGEAMKLLRLAMPQRKGRPAGLTERLAARAFAITLRPLRDALQLFVSIGAGDVRARDEATLGALASIVAIGLLDDDLLPDHFDKVNHLEASAWLRRHGASKPVLDSAFVRGGYDYPFAYKEGVTRPTTRWIAAGTAVRGYLNLVLNYAGSIFYHFNGATAEVLFTPYYEVLRDLGVRFAFFHKIDAIELNARGTHVEHVFGTRQARPSAGPFDYDPLIAHGKRGCWPTEPKFEQLLNGDSLRAWLEDRQLNFESDGYPASNPYSEPFRLTQGLDADDGFTHILLAVPPRVVERIAGPFARADQRWREALNSARQIPTIAVELRGTDPCPSKPTYQILTANEQPFGTWADMSFLQEETNCETGCHLSYLCGAWPNRPPLANESWIDFVQREHRAARAITDAWLEKHLETTLRLGLGRSNGPLPTIESIVVRLNLDASEGYVLSPPGTIDMRLDPREAYFGNLFVAGDWTKSGIDAGCYEAALISGRLAARAINGV